MERFALGSLFATLDSFELQFKSYQKEQGGFFCEVTTKVISSSRCIKAKKH